MAAVEERLQPFSGGFFYKKSKDKAGGRMKVDFAKLKGKVITKDDFAYEEERQGWNRGVEKYPLAIVFCKNEDEIIEAMAFAAREKLPFRIRSGRHHYEGFSNGNDILVIDISLMNKIYINEEERTVTIEGGVRNRELYEAVCGAGYPFPGGGCPTVGVVGFTLGGGWGQSSRLLGLGIDSLLQVELINYKGEKILSDKKVNSDLFWALRGCGGGNFGIVTAMKFKLPHKINKATLINIDYPNLTIDDIMQYIKGPDFPLGGTIINQKDIKTALSTGKSAVSLKVRGDYEIKGDTITQLKKQYIYKDKVVYRDKLVTDTVCRVDSIPYIKTVEKTIKVNELKSWQKSLMSIGGVVCLCVLGVLFWKLFNFIKIRK